MKYFTDLTFRSKGGIMGGTIATTSFPNGYGASVITGGYGSGAAPYELAVLDKDNKLTYSTVITSDVIGYQTAEEIDVLLQRIEGL